MPYSKTCSLCALPSNEHPNGLGAGRIMGPLGECVPPHPFVAAWIREPLRWKFVWARLFTFRAALGELWFQRRWWRDNPLWPIREIRRLRIGFQWDKRPKDREYHGAFRGLTLYQRVQYFRDEDDGFTGQAERALAVLGWEWASWWPHAISS